MKKLFLFLSTSFLTVSFSQTYTISVNSVKMHVKENLVSYQEAVDYPDQIMPDVFTSTKHVLDLKDSTSTFFNYGVHVSTVKIVNFTESDSTYEFTMLDFDSVGDAVYAYMIISKDFDTVYYYWYNAYQNATKVEIKTDFVVNFEI